MQFEIHTFKDWGYPFIAQDYEGWFELGERGGENLELAAAAMFDNDDIEDLDIFLNFCVDHKMPAVMVEMYNVTKADIERKFRLRVADILESAGYTDLESYEHRTAHGKLWED